MDVGMLDLFKPNFDLSNSDEPISSVYNRSCLGSRRGYQRPILQEGHAYQDSNDRICGAFDSVLWNYGHGR